MTVQKVQPKRTLLDVFVKRNGMKELKRLAMFMAYGGTATNSIIDEMSICGRIAKEQDKANRTLFSSCNWRIS